MKSKIKYIIENICIWLLSKLDITRLTQLTFDDKKFSVSIKKFVPDDGKWHHITVRQAISLKVSPKRKKQTLIDDVAVFQDGDLQSHYKLR